MTWLNPYAVNGATLDAAMLRLVAFEAIGGAEGIAAKNDCKVTASAVPDGNVHVGVGGVLIKNRYSGGGGQSYAGYNDSLDDVAVPDVTAATTRRDAIVARIHDPDFDGIIPPPGEEDTWVYLETEVITGVPGNPKTADDLGLSYPAVLLATIQRTGPTSIVTAAQITDRRKLARPRREESRNHIPTTGTNSLNTVSPSWENFPGSAAFTVDIPSWAVRAKIQGFVEGLRLTKAGTGALRVVLVESGAATELTNLDEGNPNNVEDRASYNLGGEIPIDSSVRGTTATFRIQGRAGNAGSAGFLKLDGNSSALLSILLEEQPD